MELESVWDNRAQRASDETVAGMRYSARDANEARCPRTVSARRPSPPAAPTSRRWKRVRALRVPTLGVAGERDQMTPSRPARRWGRGDCGRALVALNAGHSMMSEEGLASCSTRCALPGGFSPPQERSWLRPFCCSPHSAKRRSSPASVECRVDVRRGPGTRNPSASDAFVERRCAMTSVCGSARSRRARPDRFLGARVARRGGLVEPQDRGSLSQRARARSAASRRRRALSPRSPTLVSHLSGRAVR